MISRRDIPNERVRPTLNPRRLYQMDLNRRLIPQMGAHIPLRFFMNGHVRESLWTLFNTPLLMDELVVSRARHIFPRNTPPYMLVSQVGSALPARVYSVE